MFGPTRSLAGEIDPIVIAVVSLYLLAMVGIGYFASRKIRANEDFMLAGRRLGPFMLAGSLAATEVGGGSSMGVAEKAYGDWGMSAGWYVLTMAITFLILAVVAPRLRSALVKTVPEYFRRRYGGTSGLLTAVIMLLPLIGLTAIQFIASSVIVSVITGLSYPLAVVLVVFVVTIYSVMGGLWSVALTDVVQWVLIVGGLLLAVPFAIHFGGGWEAMAKHIPEDKMSLTGGIGLKSIASLVILYLTSFAVGQEAVQRYFGARDEKAARLGSIYVALVYSVFAFIPALLGVIAFSCVESGRIDGSIIEAEGAKYVLPILVLEVMPGWLVGIVFAALIAATMSSADSDLLAAGSIFANDIYAELIRPQSSEAETLLVTRVTMVAIAGLALVVALTSQQNMISILMFSFTLRAGGAFIPYVIGHYWRRAGNFGAIASILFGSAAVVLVEHDLVPFFGLEPIVPGLFCSLVSFVIFSLLGKRLGSVVAKVARLVSARGQGGKEKV